VTRSWRQLRNEKLSNLCSPSGNMRMIRRRSVRLVGHVAYMGTNINAYIVLVENPEGERPLGRSRRK
jgi:hypothetical protein